MLARNLSKYRELTIFTHSPVVAQAMQEVLRITVVMTSGIVRRDTVS
jgi:DeoR/GlpR family transcriptional regulator of sugar metabolism